MGRSRTQVASLAPLRKEGQENVDVARKDKAAALWCENATERTGTVWKYLKVPQKLYEQLDPSDFSDLQTLGLWSQG